MRLRIYLGLAMVAALMIGAGCAAQSVAGSGAQTGETPSRNAFEVRTEDFDMVNEYLREIGTAEIPSDAAEEMSHRLKENTTTQEITTDWKLLVDYIRNLRSGMPNDPSYTIEFGKEGLTMRMDTFWEDIGG